MSNKLSYVSLADAWMDVVHGAAARAGGFWVALKAALGPCLASHWRQVRVRRALTRYTRLRPPPVTHALANKSLGNRA